MLELLFCVWCYPAQTAPHIIREPDADVAREKAYKEGEDVLMACVADQGSDAELVYYTYSLFSQGFGVIVHTQF